MNFIHNLLAQLAAIENPFRFDEAYIVPARGDQLRDVARFAEDFRPVYRDLTHVANAELSRHVIAAN
nr:hypothetical protein [uncultured Roseateles sp.]